MKFWNMLGTVSRYVLAAVSCISLAQFLLLLNVGTENAGRLAGQSLGRGVITGLVAAVWFYRARKIHLPASANVQTQVQVTPPPSSQAQPVAPPRDSVSATVPVSAPITTRSGSSFWNEKPEFIALTVVAVVAIILAALTMGRSWQSSALITGTSQPRFIHVQGAPAWKMFDNKTGQDCNTQTITYDSVDLIKGEMRLKVHRDFYEIEKKASLTYPFDNTLDTRVDKVTDELVDVALQDMFPSLRVEKQKDYPDYKEFYDRYGAVIANPDKPPVYHYNGMPYCSELSKKWL